MTLADRIGILSDVVGFIGGLLAVLPFILRRRLVDDLELLSDPEASSEKAADAARSVARNFRRERRQHLRTDYNLEASGIGLVCLAFALKVLSWIVMFA